MSNRSDALFVGDVMTESVVSAHEHAVYKEIVDALQRNRIGAVPVIDMNRRVIGVISESDLLVRTTGENVLVAGPPRLGAGLAARRKARGADAVQLMTSPPVTVSPTTTIPAAARLLLKARVHQLPVVDDNGTLVGMLCRSDLLRPYLRDDLEIAAEIQDAVVAERMLLDPASIALTVEEGVVTLGGQLENNSIIEDLLGEVRSVEGVMEVVDHLHAKTTA